MPEEKRNPVEDVWSAAQAWNRARERLAQLHGSLCSAKAAFEKASAEYEQALRVVETEERRVLKLMGK